MARIIVALALLVSATAAGLAQSQSGANFGTPYSGTAAARNGGHYYYRYARSHHGGGQSARGGGGGIETDPTNKITPVAPASDPTAAKKPANAAELPAPRTEGHGPALKPEQ